MIVVSDTSPVVALTCLGRFDLLHKLFGKVLIPPAVASELRRGTDKWRPIDVVSLPNIEVRAPTQTGSAVSLRPGIHPGESEAILLAQECGADLLLVDDKRGRELARELGISFTGTLGVLLRAKAAGLVPAVTPMIDRLVEGVGFFVSDEVRDAIVRRAGEYQPP